MSDSNQVKKSPFDDYSFARLYEKRNAQFGYPGALLNNVVQQLKKFNVTTVVDVGAGTGAFSIPLSNAGYTVYAIEPASGMRNILSDKITKFSGKLIVHPYTLEEMPPIKADACIAMHSLYGIKPLEKALVRMMHIAPLVMIAVRTEKTYTLSDLVRSYFKKERPKHYEQQIITFLKEHSIPYTEYFIRQVHNVHIHDIYQEAYFHCKAMGFDESYIHKIIAILEKHLHKNETFWFENVHDDAVITILL